MSSYLRDRAIGDRIRTARKRRGWTLRMLAAEIGIHAASLQQAETGASHLSDQRLADVASALGLPVCYFTAELPVAEISDEEAEMVRALRALPPEGRAYLQRIAIDAAAGRIAR
ncbi:helix-turn-helix domain-containing protein [Methylobacterium aquaticum]|uniref:helix-turn-helix domain-containing protein n=1 Tax=Methylobacterium aquaticum TaxID=270351 RepID=UPI003D17DB9D